MSIREILLLGDQKLYQKSNEVTYEDLDEVKRVIIDLDDTISNFKATYGVGRAIAAPQIGYMKRLIYMKIDEPIIFINPVLTNKSSDMIEILDDCMSFPNLLVKVMRHRSCRIEYRDLNWKKNFIDLYDDRSELLQHEYDHLDGILAVDRAIDKRSFFYKMKK